jgi:hypothetical protein
VEVVHTIPVVVPVQVEETIELRLALAMMAFEMAFAVPDDVAAAVQSRPWIRLMLLMEICALSTPPENRAPPTCIEETETDSPTLLHQVPEETQEMLTRLPVVVAMKFGA